jgi:hypothetical protein
MAFDKGCSAAMRMASPYDMSRAALRAGGATLRAIQAVLAAQHGRKLSLDALHRVLADQSAGQEPQSGTV